MSIACADLLSGDGSGCGEMLAEFQQQRGFPTEIDLFIGQTVLQVPFCMAYKPDQSFKYRIQFTASLPVAVALFEEDAGGRRGTGCLHPPASRHQVVHYFVFLTF